MAELIMAALIVLAILTVGPIVDRINRRHLRALADLYRDHQESMRGIYADFLRRKRGDQERFLEEFRRAQREDEWWKGE